MTHLDQLRGLHIDIILSISLLSHTDYYFNLNVCGQLHIWKNYCSMMWARRNLNLCNWVNTVKNKNHNSSTIPPLIPPCYQISHARGPSTRQICVYILVTMWLNWMQKVDMSVWAWKHTWVIWKLLYLISSNKRHVLNCCMAAVHYQFRRHFTRKKPLYNCEITWKSRGQQVELIGIEHWHSTRSAPTWQSSVSLLPSTWH